MDYKQKFEKMRQKKERLELKAKERLETLRLRSKDRLAKVSAKKKQKSIHKLKTELWGLTSQIVRASSHICYTCNRILAYPNRQAGHHFSKGGHQGTMFDLDNLRVQDAACNLFKSGNQAEFSYRLRKELGDERYEALYQRANTPHKWTREALEQLIIERKAILNRLENEEKT
jgi:hypothetical protein